MSDIYNENIESTRELTVEDFEKPERLDNKNESRRRNQGRVDEVDSDELPETLYRLKTLHSCETFFGYYEPSGSEWPHFRTMAELDALLEGPITRDVPECAALIEAEGLTAPDQDQVSPDAAVQPDIAAQEVQQNHLQEEPSLQSKPQGEQQRIPRRALVVSPTKYGKDVVEVQGVVADTRLVNLDEIVLIERPACIDDLRKLKENADKERQAFELCRDKIWARNLPMKLVSAHYLIDEPKILFYFAAESRVDFRELVKDLVSLFKIRIELRQIGVRDEARVTGGCGVCGRVLCCHGISDRLNPVSIKMAKDQNLSLNSLKISGPCGRLLCCLSYEFQFYRDARRELPQEGVKFIYEAVLFKVVEVNALTSTVKMAGEDGRVLDMKAERFKYSEGRWKVIEDQD
jgi:cell fate regulator YaaT (PSP1 superfamily)